MSTLEADLEQMRKLAYRRVEWCGAVVERYYALHKKRAKVRHFHYMEKVYQWMLVPLKLWAVNFQDLLRNLLAQMESHGEMEEKWRFLVESLPPIPSQKVQKVGAQHEHDVQKGNYAMQVKATAKFDLREEALMKDGIFQTEWRAIKEMFLVNSQRDYKGVIRRTLVAERGFRPKWESPQTQGNFFCFRRRSICFVRNGMQHDRPLLQRLTVNLSMIGSCSRGLRACC